MGFKPAIKDKMENGKIGFGTDSATKSWTIRVILSAKPCLPYGTGISEFGKTKSSVAFCGIKKAVHSAFHLPNSGCWWAWLYRCFPLRWAKLNPIL